MEILKSIGIAFIVLICFGALGTMVTLALLTINHIVGDFGWVIIVSGICLVLVTVIVHLFRQKPVI